MASLLAFDRPARADSAADDHYGPFGLLDHRSKYNTGWFPEPLLTDEMDGDQEVRLNYRHFEQPGTQVTEVSAEVEKNFGNLTIELELPYEREATHEDGEREVEEGIGPFEISARHPFAQYVSPSGAVDLTVGARVELAIATQTDISKDNEIVFGLYQTLGLGEHFNIQASIGSSTIFGPGEDGGSNALEYAVVLGYNLDIDTAVVSRITPIVELDAETGMNHGLGGNTSVLGVVGGVFTFAPNSLGQPKLGIGYIFPINDDARDEFDWGVTTSLIFEF